MWMSVNIIDRNYGPTLFAGSCSDEVIFRILLSDARLGDLGGVSLEVLHIMSVSRKLIEGCSRF